MKTHFRRGVGSSASRWTALALAFGLLAGLAATAGASSVQLHEGVLVSSDDGAVYVMTREGGIDALDPAAGHVVWRTHEAAKPLLLDGATLVAQTEPARSGELLVTVFDTRGAGTPLHRARLALPEGVVGAVDQSLRSTFVVDASRADQGVVIDWKSQVRPAKGVPPWVRGDLEGPGLGTAKSAGTTRRSDGTAVETTRRERGRAVLDLDSGDLEKAAALGKADDARSPVRASGPMLAELAADQRLAGIDGRQFLSADGRHVLGSVRGPAGQVRTGHRWTLFDRQSGETVGTAMVPVSARPFVVRDGVLVLVTPPRYYRAATGSGAADDWAIESYTVRGIDLRTGAERWAREVRDAEYRGPVPH